ncbi:MAG: AsmA-like C-terminal region-containing protein [Candidatus Riflebacteria bacterium]|nr:AsmA-like C-terminal region-containing protein [Candidatus Riflebacteria bacterium]
MKKHPAPDLSRNRSRPSLAGLLALLVALGSASPGTAQEAGGLQQQFERKISEFVGVPVSVREYGLEYSTVRLRGVRMGDPAQPTLPAAELGELSATCDLMSLLGGKLVLQEISLATLTGRLTLDEGGALVRGGAVKPASASLPLDLRDLPFTMIRGTGLAIRIDDHQRRGSLHLRIPAAAVTKSEDRSGLAVELAGAVAWAADGPADPPTDLAAGKLSGRITDLAAPKVSFGFALDPLNLSAIGTLLLPPGGYRLSGAGAVAGTLAGPLAQMTITGKVTVASGAVIAPVSANDASTYTFPWQDLVAPFHFAGKTLSISKARATMFGGRLEADATVHPGRVPAGFEMKAQAAGLRAESFLSQNTTQKQVVAGPVDGSFEATGDASGLSSWNGKGSLAMREGAYHAPPVITPVLSLLNLDEFAAGDIQEGRGTFLLRRGIMTTDDLFFQSPVGRADYRGDVGLDTSLKGKLDLVFARPAVEKSRVLQELSLDGVSVKVPTRVEGTLLAPSFPGFSPQKLLELGLQRKGQKMLQDVLLGGNRSPAPAASGTAQPRKDPAQELLDGLGGLFRKKKKTAPAAPPATAPAPVPPAPTKKKSLDRQLKDLFKF